MLGRLMRTLGTAMVLVGLGLIALFFVGPPGGTAGNIPAEAQTSSTTSTEERLDESAIHLPETGFPWQEGANTYIAGHRMGFLGTDSFLVFFKLNELAQGDEVVLEDTAGGRYVYWVTEALVVGPQDTQVLEPVAGKSIVSLQTCTLPDYSDRLIVRGELVG